MKQGKAINRRRLCQPNPRKSKVCIIDTTTRRKNDKMQLSTPNCNKVVIEKSKKQKVKQELISM